MIVEAGGGPLGVVVAGANVHDTKLLEKTIDAIVVDRPEPTKKAPQHLCLDKGYDNPTGHAAVEKKNTRPTSAASARKSSTRKDASPTRRAGGWWSERSAG